jgi:hypothetical protein
MDHAFLAHVNQLFDPEPLFEEVRRARADEDQISITNPLLNIVGGIQPKFMTSLFPDEAWGMGTTSRMIFIEAAKTAEYRSRFSMHEIDNALFAKLSKELRQIAGAIGRFKWEPEAIAALDDWGFSGYQPVPTHSKLENYVIRREVFVLKLSMVASISRARPWHHDPQGPKYIPVEPTVTLADFQRARGWLLEAESRMPDIFKLMFGKSDAQTFEELHMWAFREYERTGKKPFSIVKAYQFLSNRVANDKIVGLIDNAIAMGLLTAVGVGTSRQVKPNPRDTFTIH